MNDFFDKLEGFLDAARQGATDLKKKAADTLRRWADVVEGLSVDALTDSELDARLAKCEAGLKALKDAPAALADPQFDPTPWIELFLLIIEIIKKRRQKPPTP